MKEAAALNNDSARKIEMVPKQWHEQCATNRSTTTVCTKGTVVTEINGVPAALHRQPPPWRWCWYSGPGGDSKSVWHRDDGTYVARRAPNRLTTTVRAKSTVITERNGVPAALDDRHGGSLAEVNDGRGASLGSFMYVAHSSRAYGSYSGRQKLIATGAQKSHMC